MTPSDGAQHLGSPRDCKASLVQQVSTVQSGCSAAAGEADTDRLRAAQMGSPGGVHVELLARISYPQRKIKTTSRKQFTLSFQPDRTLHTLAPLISESEPSFSLMEDKMVPQHFSHLRNLMIAQGIQ